MSRNKYAHIDKIVMVLWRLKLISGGSDSCRLYDDLARVMGQYKQ